MKEIGGYIELDTYNNPMLHEGAIALNCGRNALAYLLRARKIKTIWIPKFICDSVTGVCERENVRYQLYAVGSDLQPNEEILLNNSEWLYLVNYYGQLTNQQIKEYKSKYDRIIVDNAQSYFQIPVEGVDTLYTCRKYFGVADGAFLYTNARTNEDFEIDESFERIHFLLGRYERTASEFYEEYKNNNKIFVDEPIKKMSKLTKNFLHAIDYVAVEHQRKSNFEILDKHLNAINQLELKTGSFMYPLKIENGAKVRKNLQSKKIYIPTLWPYVFKIAKETDIEYQLAENILPLPIDQRYGIEDMDYIIQLIRECLNQ